LADSNGFRSIAFFSARPARADRIPSVQQKALSGEVHRKAPSVRVMCGECRQPPALIGLSTKCSRSSVLACWI